MHLVGIFYFHNMSILTSLGDLARGKTDLSTPARSSKWPGVRINFLKLNPTCAVCGGTKTLEVHHIRPFHIHPELELVPTNLIALCESGKYGINCHLLVGHLGNYKSINTDMLSDTLVWRAKLLNRPTDAKSVQFGPAI